MPKEIGKRVKDMREAMDLSQLELASMANIPQSTLSNIENAEQVPAIDKVAKLADALGDLESVANLSLARDFLKSQEDGLE